MGESTDSGVRPGHRNVGALLPLLLFAGLFALYAVGSSRTIYVGDSGELVTAVALLGVPHPTGYPLYVLLGKLWTLLVPVGSIATRMSLMSAACAAGAATGLFLLARRGGLGVAAALLGSLVLAVSGSFWSQANIQRVYALNALCLVLALTAAWRWYASRAPGPFVLTFFLAALGATNHTYMAVFLACFALFAILTEPELLRRPQLLVCAGAALVVGLLPYAYLPLRSRADPRLDWGDPETLDRFLDVVLRRDFWDRKWLEGPLDLLVIGGDFVLGLAAEVTWIGLLLAAVGLAATWLRSPSRGLRRWPVLLLVLIAAGNVTSMALHGSRSDLFLWHRYYIPSYVVLALFLAAGWQAIADRFLPPRAAWAGLLLPAALVMVRFSDYDRSRYRIGEDYSRTLLASLPPGSHLAASDDNILFILLYLHLVEGVRPDVDLIPQGVGDAELPPLRFDPDEVGLFFTHHPNWQNPALEVVPMGLAMRVMRAGRPWPEPVVTKTSLDGENDPRVPKDYLTRNLIGHFHYMLGLSWEPRDWPRAKAEFERAAAVAATNDVLFYNLGLIYRRNGLYDRSLAAFRRSHAINPRHLASQGRVRAMDRIAEVELEAQRIESLEERLAEQLGDDYGDAAVAEQHLQMARLLTRAGELLAARGRRLLALEAGARQGE